MPKLLVIMTGFVLMLLLGCSHDEDGGTPPSQVRDLWPRGTNPVPNSVDSRVLFTQEEPPAGLYVLRDGSATILNPSGPEARGDYTWAADARRIAFSSPGTPGNELAGVWISDADALASLHRIWDRGSHPRFYPVETLLVCAGPDDGSDDEGIWQMDFQGNSRELLLSTGLEPEISPDGTKIAYLMTTGSSMGRTLMVYHRASMIRDTVAVYVLRHAWLSDSQTLVYETIQNGPQEINLVGPNDGLLGVTVASGTLPSAMLSSSGFFFTAILGDHIDGIFRASLLEDPVRISNVGTSARHAGSNHVVAQDSNGLIEISF